MRIVPAKSCKLAGRRMTGPRRGSQILGGFGRWLRAVGFVCGTFCLVVQGMVSIDAAPADSSVAPVHGDFITAPPVDTNQIGQSNAVRRDEARRRHASTPSAQARMVMFQLKLDQLTDDQPVNSTPPGPVVPSNYPALDVTIKPVLPGYFPVGFDKLASFDFVLTDELVRAPQAGAAPPPQSDSRRTKEARRPAGGHPGISPAGEYGQRSGGRIPVDAGPVVLLLRSAAESEKPSGSR